MARVPYIEYDDASEEVRELYESATRITGRVTNLHKIMAHAPWLYRWYLPLQMSAQRDGIGVLDHRSRTLAHVKTSLVNACEYCTEHTSTLGRYAGVLSDEEFEALQQGHGESDHFDEKDIAVIEWSEAVAMNRARRETELFERLSQHFSDTEIVELTMVIAVRCVANKVVDSLWGDLEDASFPRNKRTHLSQEPLIEHCETVLRQLRSDTPTSSAPAPTA